MKNRVATKFYWLIAISLLLAIVISSITIANYLLNRFEKEVQNKDELHLKGLAANVDGFIKRTFSLNYQLSINPFVVNSILQSQNRWETRVSSYSKKYDVENGLGENSGLPLLRDIQQRYDFIELLFLQDTTGNQTARSFGKLGQRGNRWWFNQFMSDPNHTAFFSKSYFSLTGNKPVSSVFHPVKNKGELIGILGMDLNFDYLQEFVSKHIFSEDLYAMIIDNEGVIIAHPDKQKLRELYDLKRMTREIVVVDADHNPIMDASGHLKSTEVDLDWAPEMSTVVQKSSRGENGHLVNIELEGKPSTVYYRSVRIPGPENENFTIILVRDHSTLDQPKNQIIIFVCVFTFITIIILLTLFQLYFRRIVLKPLLTLTDFIKKVDPDQNDRIDLNTRDEFQQLADTFNDMYRKLQASRHEVLQLNEGLEEKVETRTTELKSVNENLSKEIEKHRETAEKLLRAKEEAEQANLSKSQFLANISHELRTPMHGILGFVSLCLGKVESVERTKLKEFLTEIDTAGHRLLNLLDDLLDLSRLESGKVKYSFEKQSLSEQAKKVISELSVFMKGKGIELIFNEPEGDDEAEFDSGKMIQVFQNLLSNATKFSKQSGKVEIQMKQVGNNLNVSVKDWGIGIPSTELESVFDKFIQSSKTDNGAGGTGLGLSICHKIISDHKGRIWAELNPEGGTIIRFEIPKSQPITVNNPD